MLWHSAICATSDRIMRCRRRRWSMRRICGSLTSIASSSGIARFLALAAQMMRRILVEFARHRDRQKRGGRAVHLRLDDIQERPESPERDPVALSDALTGLATFDARMSQVVELRFFGGLTVKETAQVLNVSAETVIRDWNTAKAWLLREIRRGQATPSR